MYSEALKTRGISSCLQIIGHIGDGMSSEDDRMSTADNVEMAAISQLQVSGEDSNSTQLKHIFILFN